MSVSTPFIEIRPRCSNASITYYFTGGSTGAAASSFRLLLNGPAPYISTILPPQWGYTQTGLTNGAYYSSLVTAIASDGSESAPVAFRTVQPNGFPDPPQNVTAIADVNTSKIVFNWNFPSAPQTAKIGWYVATDSNDTSIRSNTTASFSTMNLNVVPGTNHFYYLQSVNDPGYSTKASAGNIFMPYTEAYYPFESTINDSFNTYNMASNGDLTYNSTIKFIGDLSLEFNGTNAFTSFDNGFPYFTSWPGFTWMGWVYLTDNTDYRTLFDIGQNVNTYLLTHLFNNKMYLAIASNQGLGGFAANVAGPDVNLNTWDHYAFTLGHGAMKIYRNGVYQVQAGTDGLGISNIAPTVGYFGKSFAAYPYLQGYLDDVGMFNYDLNPTQIEYIYSTQTATLSSLSSLTSGITSLA